MKLFRTTLFFAISLTVVKAFSYSTAGMQHRREVRAGQWAYERENAKTSTSSISMKGFGASTDKKKQKTVPQIIPPASADGAPIPGVTKFELPKDSHFMGCIVLASDKSASQVVDDLVAFFNSCPEKHLQGMISMKGGDAPVVNKEIKESREMSFGPKDSNPAWQKYIRSLGSVMAAYVQDYPMSAAYGKFGLTSRSNFQYYPAGGGYKTYHTERTGAGEPEGSRHLVYMTYLNDVTDAGGTEFYHQKLTVSPRKGLTLIWPADWTFTHRGVPSPSQVIPRSCLKGASSK